MLEIATDDLFLLGMAREPVAAVPEELFHLVVANPVMLVVVEHRDEDVQVREQVSKGGGHRQLDGEVGPLAPLGERFVERVPCGDDGITERLKELAEQCLAAAAGQDADPGDEGDARLREFRALSTRAGERGAEDPARRRR